MCIQSHISSDFDSTFINSIPSAIYVLILKQKKPSGNAIFKSLNWDGIKSLAYLSQPVFCCGAAVHERLGNHR